MMSIAGRQTSHVAKAELSNVANEAERTPEVLVFDCRH